MLSLSTQPLHMASVGFCIPYHGHLKVIRFLAWWLRLEKCGGQGKRKLLGVIKAKPVGDTASLLPHSIGGSSHRLAQIQGKQPQTPLFSMGGTSKNLTSSFSQFALIINYLYFLHRQKYTYPSQDPKTSHPLWPQAQAQCLGSHNLYQIQVDIRLLRWLFDSSSLSVIPLKLKSYELKRQVICPHTSLTNIGPSRCGNSREQGETDAGAPEVKQSKQPEKELCPFPLSFIPKIFIQRPPYPAFIFWI